jgi:nucleotide-binding universal stress UspA family protein
MRNWRRICCAVDLSDPSRAALETACELAAVLAIPLALLHVWGAPPAGPAAPFAPPPRPVRGEEEDRRRLDAWLADAAARTHGNATLEERHGDAAKEIVAYAGEAGCDLIVVGTHGRTGVKRALLGSVAEAVVRTASCPVLIVRPK